MHLWWILGSFRPCQLFHSYEFVRARTSQKKFAVGFLMFDTEVASVDVVSEEEVRHFRWVATNLAQLHEIILRLGKSAGRGSK
jgi:hypothetical protein